MARTRLVNEANSNSLLHYNRWITVIATSVKFATRAKRGLPSHLMNPLCFVSRNAYYFLYTGKKTVRLYGKSRCIDREEQRRIYNVRLTSCQRQCSVGNSRHPRHFTGDVNAGTPCDLKKLHDDAISYR